MSGSTRTAAIRLSTEDLDAARGKFEALGSLGDQVLDRITQAGQRASSSMSGIAGPEGAFNRRAADIAAYGANLDRVQASFNPLFGAMRRYETTLAEIAQAERVGALASGEAVAARQRAFAGYEQQVSANANLAESYGQLGVAVTRLIDVQQAANRGAGVSTPLAGDALAARSEDIAAYGDTLNRLQASFNPLVAAQQRYGASVAEIAQAERVGAIASGEAVAARQRAFSSYEQQVAANAELAQSYGQLGIAVTRMVDVQQAASRGAGVVAPLAGEALAARAGDIAAYGAELDRLQASFNPLIAAQQRYETSLSEIARAEQAGAIASGEAVAARQRAFASYEQQVAANTNLAESYGQLGVAVLRMADVQQAANRGAGVMAPLAGEGLAARAADIAAYGAELNRLRASFNPLIAAQQRYEVSLAEIAQAERAGAIASGEAVDARQRAFATYEQQISANANLAESYGQLGVAVLRMVDVQQAANRGAGVMAPLAADGLVARAADIAAYGAELDRLQASLNPLIAAQQRYEASLAEIAMAERAGAIASGEAVVARQRASATYEQQTAANASLAESYGQLGVAVTRLIDVQQAANRGAGVATPLAGEALAARAGDIAAYGAELDRLQASLNPLIAAQQRYEASLADIARAEQVGAIASGEAAIARQRAFATYDQQVAANASLAASYGELGVAILRIVDVQAAASRGAGVTAPLAGDALAARTADIAAYGAELDRLQASFNPLVAVQQRYEASLAAIAQTERVGAIASGEAVAARQQAFASYEQQTAVNASLAESYGQLGVAVRRMVDVQQAANRGAGVAAPLAGEALAARAADVAAYGAELDRLRAKYDPLFAATKRFETALEEIAFAERVGAIDTATAARAHEATTKAFNEAAQQGAGLTVSAGQTAFALRQLGVQSMQAVSSIAAGQPVMMTMIQQGHQVADVAIATGTGFGVLGTAARMVAGALLSPIGAAVAIGGAFALAVAHAASLESEARQLSVALHAVGREGDLATASLQTYITTLQHAGVARAEAASIVQGLARVPTLDTAGIQKVVGLTADTAAALGSSDQAAVAKRLGEIASGSYAALKALDDELNILTADQRAAIRVMLEHGERTEAVAKVMDALRARVRGLDQEALSPTAKAMRALGNEWSSLMDRIAQSGPIQAAIVGLTAIAAAANKLLEAEPPTVAIDRRIAQIDTKLAERDSYGAPAVSGDAERILRAQRANLMAERMLAGGQVQGLAAAAPDVPKPAMPSNAVPGAAEAERQQKQLEDINKALAEQQRLLAAGLPDRVRVKAEIEAEAYIRDHALTGLAAEEYRRKSVALAMAAEIDARGQELAAIERTGSAQMVLVRAAEQGRAAMLSANAAAEAHEQAATHAGVAESTLAAAILNRNAAQEAAKGAQVLVELNEQIAATQALIAAERGGDRTAYYAAIDEKVRQATVSLRAHRDAATDPAIKAALTAEVVLIGQKTAAQERLNADLDAERALRAGQGQLDDLRSEASLIGLSAEQRERELAALRAIRSLVSSGKAPDAGSLSETQQALVEQAKEIASANFALKQQQSLYEGIANAASQAFDQVGSAIANAFTSGQRAAINWGNVASSIISSVVQQALKLAVINPLLNSVLGTSLPAASISSGMSGVSSFGSSGLFSGIGSLFGGSGGISGLMATPLWGADVAGPVTASGIAASGAPTLGTMLGGVGAGFGAGMLLNSLLGGHQLGGTIGSGVGAMAGAAIGSIIPGIGTLIGGLIGGAAGGGLGGLFGPGPKHHGWSWTLGADDAGMIGFRTANVDPVAQQQFAQEQQQVAAFNAWMAQQGMRATGAYIVGGNNDPNLEHDYASFAAGFSNLRFTAANDNRLNGLLGDRAFTDPTQLADFTTFVTQTLTALEKAPLSDFTNALKGVNDTYDAAIAKAKQYALAEDGLTTERDRRLADITARRDLQASSLTAGMQVRYLRATGGNEQADLLAQDTAAAQERQQLNDQILAMGLDGTQYAAERLVQIEQTLAAERLAIQQRYADQSRQLTQQAESVLGDLSYGGLSALAPEQKYFASLTALNQARQTLDAGGTLADFTTVAQQVLPVARDFLGTSERYAALVADIAGAVASKGGDPAGLSGLLQAQVDGTDALRDTFARYSDQQLSVASATLSELRRLASAIEALMARSVAA